MNICKLQLEKDDLNFSEIPIDTDLIRFKLDDGGYIEAKIINNRIEIRSNFKTIKQELSITPKVGNVFEILIHED